MEPHPLGAPTGGVFAAMVLEGSRRHFDLFILPLAKGLRRANPNHLTLVGLLFAIPGAALIWASDPADEGTNYFLVVATALVFLHGLFDLLDGVVARLYQGTSRLGDYLDHVVDRVADILLLAAVSFSPWGDPRVGFFAIAFTLLVSYLGTQAQAVGAGRMYTGFLARADRIVLLMAACLVDHVLAAGEVEFEWVFGIHSALGAVLWYITLGGGITAIERFLRIYLFLHRSPRA